MRHYVPELAHYDKKYIYEPWKAPIADQKKWGCLIKGDGGAEAGEEALQEEAAREGEYGVYPKPMFDFSQRREVCIQAIKKAYAIGLHGSDAKVKDGSWRQLFDDDAEGPTQGEGGPPGTMLEESKPARTEKGEKQPAQSASQAGAVKRFNSSGQTTLDGMLGRGKRKRTS